MRKILLLLLSLMVFAIAFTACEPITAKPSPEKEEFPDTGNMKNEDFRTFLKSTYYDDVHYTPGSGSSEKYKNARIQMYNYIDNVNGNVICVYSGYIDPTPYGGTVTFPDPINCEHTVPQSWYDKDAVMRSDLHHLFPTHEDPNQYRGSFPFADIDDEQTTKWYLNGIATNSIPASNIIDEYGEFNGYAFEPREEQKGNTARAIFYFFTMYDIVNFSKEESHTILDIGDPAVLYQWHINDPVDEAEKERNRKIAAYQGSRNPYIEHPEYVIRAYAELLGN